MKSDIEFLNFEKNNSISEIEKNLLEIIDSIDKNVQLFDDASVEYGKMGLALFYFYCHQHYNDEKFLEKGEHLINESIIWISNIGQVQFTPKYRGDSLSNVISSFGKGLLFLQYNWDYSYDFESFYVVIEDTLEELTARNLKEKDFDYFSGALSAGYFFLNKYYYQKDEKSKLILNKIYLSIQECAVHASPNEVYWKASYVYHNLIYLGISHGSAMLVNFISKLIKCNVIENDNLNKDFLNKAVNLIVNQKRALVEGFFPNFYTDEAVEKELPTIFGVCYGDLGVLYALHNANEILKDSSLEAKITSMLISASQRKMNPKHTYDAGLLYGASGVFCVFKELYEITQVLPYKECYKYWFKQIMVLKNPQIERKAGYTFICTPKEINQSISDEFSLGWGLAGIGISLLVEINPNLPSLQEVTLLGKRI
jgi:hypothetical protein